MKIKLTMTNPLVLFTHFIIVLILVLFTLLSIMGGGPCVTGCASSEELARMGFISLVLLILIIVLIVLQFKAVKNYKLGKNLAFSRAVLSINLVLSIASLVYFIDLFILD